MSTLYIRYPGIPTSDYPLLAPDGTVSAPSYSFANSSTTGLYSSAANTLDLAVNGIDAVHLLSTGGVVLGATDNNLQTHTWNAKKLTILGKSTGTDSLQVLVNSQSANGGDTNLYIWNQGTSDARINFQTDSQVWGIGSDQSASNALKISSGGVLGTNDYFSLTTTGSMVLGTSGGQMGFFGHAAAAQATYTISSASTLRSYTVGSETLDNVANVLATLIADLRAIGLVL